MKWLEKRGAAGITGDCHLPDRMRTKIREGKACHGGRSVEGKASLQALRYIVSGRVN